MPREGEEIAGGGKQRRRWISIHIPRVGDDAEKLQEQINEMIFQSTSPVWGMTGCGGISHEAKEFQSTSPVWGMTGGSDIATLIVVDFNPHPPCGG